MTLEVRRNEPDYDPAQALRFVVAVNSLPFFGASKEQVRCVHFAPTQEYKATATHVKILYRFEFRKDGWKGRFIQRGRWMKQDGKRVIITNADRPGTLIKVAQKNSNAQVTTPQLLTKDGQLLPDGAPPEFGDVEKYPLANFNELRLTQAWS